VLLDFLVRATASFDKWLPKEESIRSEKKQAAQKYWYEDAKAA
jgi:hypothetical protein